jgi:hypothetical protein
MKAKAAIKSIKFTRKIFTPEPFENVLDAESERARIGCEQEE